MAIAARGVASPIQHGAAASQSQAPETKGEMRQQMMAKMHAPDGQLERLVAAMDVATGDAKVAAMAELLTRLVQRQTTMREDMRESMKAMMAQCPMAKEAAAHEHTP
jgi:hypothetical protein